MATYKCPKCSFVFGNRLAGGKYTKSVDGFRSCPNCHSQFLVGTQQKAVRFSEYNLKALKEWSDETGLTQKEIINLAVTSLIKDWERIRRGNLERDSRGKDESSEGRERRLKGIPHIDRGLGKLVAVGGVVETVEKVERVGEGL